MLLDEAGDPLLDEIEAGGYLLDEAYTTPAERTDTTTGEDRTLYV